MEPFEVQGRVVSTLKTPHFVVIEALYGAGTRIAEHSHASDSIAFSVSGEFVESAAGERFSCDADTIVMCGANQTHSEEFRVDTRCVIITPSDRPTFDFPAALRRARSIRGTPLRASLLHVWDEMRRNDAASPLGVDGSIFMLFAEALRACNEPNPSNDRIGRSLKMLHETRGQNANVRELARASGMSAHTFTRAFKRETGYTIGDYVRRLRIEHAKELLRTTSMSLREIALELGYCDQSHFTKAFSRYARVAPSTYRRSFS